MAVLILQRIDRFVFRLACIWSGLPWSLILDQNSRQALSTIILASCENGTLK